MTSRNPYEPPESTVSTKESAARNSSGTAVGRVFKVILGSGLAAVLGLGAGLLGATLYAQHYHPNDPEPMDFTIGAILLLVWLGVWLAGTALAAWFAFRKPRANSA